MLPPDSPALRAAYREERRAVAERGARVTAWCALTLIPAFAYLDTVVFPEHQSRFFALRASCMVIGLAVLAALRTPFGRRHALALGVAVPVSVGLNVDVMTAIAAREANPYYAGVMIVLLAASLLLPWPPLVALAVSVLLVGAYVVGIVAGGPVHDVPVFMTNVFIMGTMAVLVVVGAALSDRLRRQEFASRRRLNQHARRQEAIARLGQAALQAPGSAALVERALTVVADALDVEICEMLEPGSDGRSPAALALEDGAPVLVEDLAHDPRFPTSTSLHARGARSGVSVVVGGRERAFGVFGAFTSAVRTFTRDEVEFLEAVAGVLATAAVREQAEAALTEEVRTSNALARVGRELISSLETPVLLDRLCELTCDVLGAAYSNTWLWQDEGRAYVPISGHGLAPDHWEALARVQLPEVLLEDFLDRLHRDEILYLRPEKAALPILGRLLERHGATLAVCVGFRRGDELSGVQVAAFRDRGDPLTPHQERLLHGIAQLATMALTNARLVEKLERASQLKSEFVSTMSHELRTPLNVILGYTDMLADTADAGERAHFLGKVRTSSLELLELVEATLDLGRITAGKDAPRLERIELGHLWDELRADFAALSVRPGVALAWQALAHPVELVTDRRKLKIIVKNLVGNALKFTPAGEVAVGCVVAGDACTFTVRDTGIGIPPEQLSSIFDIFRQVDSSDARSYGGVGLGLHIVRSLLGQLGGDVQVTSALGAGSTFTVRVPLVATVAAAEAAAPPSA